jgi:15-cis-phytoene synthase
VTVVPALEVEHAYLQCEQITRREAANFYYGIRLLPRAKRQAMCAVYAFARRVDDIGDGSLEPELQLAALAVEREALSQVESEGADGGDPVLVGLGNAHRHYDLPLDALMLLIEGVECDVLGRRYETFEELVGYCRRVAGSVGRLCLAIFAGEANRNGNGAAALADDLGVAMQLTNILRDVREDAERGRMYLPAEDLRRFGCTGDTIAEDARSTELIRYEAGRAAEWFDRGLRLVDMLDARSASCVMAMTGIYRCILQRIVREPDQVFQGRISLPPWEKAWVAARSLAVARPGGALL